MKAVVQHNWGVMIALPCENRSVREPCAAEGHQFKNKSGGKPGSRPSSSSAHQAELQRAPLLARRGMAVPASGSLVRLWRVSNVREDEQVDRSLRLSGPVTGNIVDAATHGTVDGEKWPGGRLTPEPPLVGLRRVS